MPELFQRICEQNGWAYEDGTATIRLAEDRQQVVHCDVFEAEDEELLRVYTIIGDFDKLTDVRIQAALSINAHLVHGALAVVDDQLVMVDTFRLAAADPEEVTRSIRFLAGKSDHYEKTMFGTDAH
jgi:hypothetical protein